MTTSSPLRQLWFGLRLQGKHKEWLKRSISTLDLVEAVSWDYGNDVLDLMAATANADDCSILVVFTETWSDQLKAEDRDYLHNELSKRVFYSVFGADPSLDSDVVPCLLPLNFSSVENEPHTDIRNFRLLLANLRFYTSYLREVPELRKTSSVQFENIVPLPP